MDGLQVAMQLRQQAGDAPPVIMMRAIIGRIVSAPRDMMVGPDEQQTPFINFAKAGKMCAKSLKRKTTFPRLCVAKYNLSGGGGLKEAVAMFSPAV
jgi:hypothetical protein